MIEVPLVGFVAPSKRVAKSCTEGFHSLKQFSVSASVIELMGGHKRVLG